MTTDRTVSRQFVYSSKCDLVLRGQSDASAHLDTAVRTQLEATVQGMRVGVDADKGDWRVTGTATDPARFQGELAFQKGNWQIHATVPRGRLAAGSDKCDWRIHIDDRVTDPAAATAGFQHEFRRGVTSDKCDWRVHTGSAVRNVEAVARGLGLSASLRAPRIEGGIMSDKCDWSMRGATRGVQRAPQIETRLASSKCDFALQIEFGRAGGRVFRVHAVASAKCDFQLRRVEVSDGPDWQPIVADAAAS